MKNKEKLAKKYADNSCPVGDITRVGNSDIESIFIEVWNIAEEIYSKQIEEVKLNNTLFLEHNSKLISIKEELERELLEAKSLLKEAVTFMNTIKNDRKEVNHYELCSRIDKFLEV